MRLGLRVVPYQELRLRLGPLQGLGFEVAPLQGLRFRVVPKQGSLYLRYAACGDRLRAGSKSLRQ